MNKNITEHRVRYHDTDHFGVVYYANYLKWFEAGRTEVLRDNGITYSDFEKQGLFAPVVEVKLTYKSPARYDDLIVLETVIETIGNSSIKFIYKVKRKSDDTLLAEGYTVNIFVDKGLKPVSAPENVRKILQ